MKLATRLKAAYGAVAAIDTVLSASTRPLAHKARFVTKPLLMPLLSASLSTTPGTSPTKGAVLAAQAGGWVGDVALLSEEKKPFVVGTTGFGLGHLAYLAAFVPLRRDRPSLVRDPRARALGVLWATTAPVMIWTARRDGVAPVVATYSALLTSMAIAATRLDSAQATTGRRLVAAGALTFVASDATLGLRKFVLDDPGPLPDLASGGRGGRRLSLSTSSPRRSETDQRQWMEGAVMATYTAAQFLISEGAGRL
jgi:uncharacterized membrane protein YhhN